MAGDGSVRIKVLWTKGIGQKLIQRRLDAALAVAGRDDCHVRTKFSQDLAAGAARSSGRWGRGVDRNALKGLIPGGHGFENSGSLGTDGQPERSVLDIAPGVLRAVSG